MCFPRDKSYVHKCLYERPWEEASWPTRRAPDAWQLPSTIDAETNSITSFWHGQIEHIQIKEADLLVWLSRRRRGPKPGDIARFNESDKRLFGAIELLMKDRNISATEAVRRLDHEGKVKGRGSAASQITRLSRLFREERRGSKR
jgi:hypothetical protein